MFRASLCPSSGEQDVCYSTPQFAHDARSQTPKNSIHKIENK